MKRWPYIALGAVGIAAALWMVPRPDLNPDTGVADPSTVAAAEKVEVLVEADPEPTAAVPGAQGQESRRTRDAKTSRGGERKLDRSEAIEGSNPLAMDRDESPQVSSSRKVVSGLENIHRILTVSHQDAQTATEVRDIAGELRLAWRHADNIDWDAMIPRMDEALTAVERSSAFGSDASLEAAVSEARVRLDDLRTKASSN